MNGDDGPSGFFLSQEVGIAFILLLIFPALTYFAVTLPSILREYLPWIGGGLISWVITLVVLYVEAIIIAALYRTVSR